MFLGQFSVLVIEDDLLIFRRMESCLSWHATARDVNIVVHHADSLMEAKRTFLAHKPVIVSVDMNFPAHSQIRGLLQHPVSSLGPEFLFWANRRFKVKSLIYTGTDPLVVKDLLVLANVHENKEPPLILRKGLNSPDDLWAKTLLDQLTY